MNKKFYRIKGGDLWYSRFADIGDFTEISGLAINFLTRDEADRRAEEIKKAGYQVEVVTCTMKTIFNEMGALAI